MSEIDSQKRAPFAGGRRLERVRCDDCDAKGYHASGAWREWCESCRGRKFVWVSIVDEGER